MPRATETLFVIEPGDADLGIPALALVPGALKREFRHDGPDWLVEIQPIVGGIALEAGMRLYGTTRVFVEDGSQVKPEELRLITPEPIQEGVNGTLWD